MSARTIVFSGMLILGVAFLTVETIRAGDSNVVEVEFGRDNVGSPFPPPSGHDQSGHATDKIVPKVVNIPVGGSVKYEIYPFHAVAIYAPGTEPEDIEVSPATLRDVSLPCVPVALEDFLIDDPENRIVTGPPHSCEEQEWTTPAGTFDTPGRYLVICTTTPHFVEMNMWGWVVVR
jgi:hypothetical protein